MSNGYIKIDIEDSTPFITVEYEDLATFKDLMFFILSPSGMELFCQTIEKDLVENNKADELKILNAMIKLINSQYDVVDDEFISPSSFR
jgi:hypothetical protein